LSAPDILLALVGLIECFESQGIRYLVGGSVASSVHGMPRATLDVDLVADLEERHAAILEARLRDNYYVDAEMIRDAVRTRTSFNVIHLHTMLKIDVFLLKDRAFDRESFGRGRPDTLEPQAPDARVFTVSTPEDVMLHKLEWYRLGNEVSERQWLDVLGVIKVQGQMLDSAYLRRWAAVLGIEDLLERALREAGFKSDK
jgi:hypothetical protein